MAEQTCGGDLDGLFSSAQFHDAVDALKRLGAEVLQVEAQAKIAFGEVAFAAWRDAAHAPEMARRAGEISMLQGLRDLVETSSGSLLAYAASEIAFVGECPAPLTEPSVAEFASEDVAAVQGEDATRSRANFAVLISSGIFVVAMLLETGGARVLKGSRWRVETAPRAHSSLHARRVALVAGGDIAFSADGVATYARDVHFDTLSSAGTISTGVAKGMRYWSFLDAEGVAAALGEAGFDPGAIDFIGTEPDASGVGISAASRAQPSKDDAGIEERQRISKATMRNRDMALKVIAPKVRRVSGNLWENGDTRVVHSTSGKPDKAYQFEMCRERLQWALDGKGKSARLMLVCADTGYAVMDPADALLLLKDRFDIREKRDGDLYEVAKIYLSEKADGSWWVSATRRPGKDAVPVILQPACV